MSQFVVPPSNVTFKDGARIREISSGDIYVRLGSSWHDLKGRQVAADDGFFARDWHLYQEV